jgi:hypothetical protein
VKKTRSDSISHIGLEYYLNQPYSLIRHHGKGYEDFIKAIQPPEPYKVTKTQLASMFNVSVVTIDKWIQLWKEEERRK